MSDPRILGLTLMAISVAAFLGSTSEVLPPETFFPAMLLFAMGAFKFLRANHEALSKAEERPVRPTVGENRNARALADRQSAAGAAIGVAPNAGGGAAHRDEPAVDAHVHAIEIGVPAAVGQLEVTTDVSFPIEIQKGDALADQLSKLNRLLEQRVLTEEEYAIAKAKLLG
jgi:hypothetical protein